jgi:rRNA-processing protein EBP2
MVKTDDHMARIKRKLLYEAAAIEKVSENKRVIIQKKFAKQAASEKQQAKAKQKHATTEAINTWKKGGYSYPSLNLSLTISFY